MDDDDNERPPRTDMPPIMWMLIAVLAILAAVALLGVLHPPGMG